MKNFLNRLLGLITSVRGAIKVHELPLGSSKKKARVAICVGHSRDGDKGAYSIGGVSEWDYNSKVAVLLARKLRASGLDPVVVKVYPKRAYSAAIRWLSSFVRDHNIDIALELHFNSASPSAQGFEYLYWHTSKEGLSLASCLMASHRSAKPDSVNRGVKAINQGRGSYLLRKLHCPVVICEPFFGSNRNDWQTYEHSHDTVASIYSQGINRYFESKTYA